MQSYRDELKNRPRLQGPTIAILIVVLALCAVPAERRAHALARVTPDRAATTGTPQRIIAVADVHGAYQEFVGILEQVRLIDANHHWVGGQTIFVQVGDVADRGAETRKALDLLMDLEREAPAQGGKVIPLLGNHEVMQMMGDLRYTTPADFQSFSTDQSEKVRDAAYREYRKFIAATRQVHDVPDDEEAHQRWLARHPLGFFEERDAYAPDGTYGRWLRTHDAVALVGDTLFLHAGLDPELHFGSLKDLNGRIHSEIADFAELARTLAEEEIIWRYMTLDEAFNQVKLNYDALQGGSTGAPADTEGIHRILALRQMLAVPNTLLMSNQSPIWYRGLALEPEQKNEAGLTKLLGRLNAHSIVVGHTVLPKFTITARFDHRVFLIDTGMLKSYYGGRASALEIKGGRFTAFYADDPNPHVLAGESGAASYRERVETASYGALVSH
ncbi:MAG TPA: metallophosphoesterase [Terriglobia bacterium]|nr:metallophosphoesterase [Terriglobia bacterium]